MVAEQVYESHFPGVDMPIARLGVRVSDIANTCGYVVESWDEDGLGKASGMFLKLPSERTVLIVEFQHLIDHHREFGPTIYIDAGEIATRGVRPLVDEVLASIGLSEQAIDWIAPPENQEIAVEAVARHASLRK